LEAQNGTDEINGGDGGNKCAVEMRNVKIGMDVCEMGEGSEWEGEKGRARGKCCR